MTNKKLLARRKRHERIRRKVFGTKDRPRMSVFRSSRNMHVQLIDDLAGKVIIALSTSCKEFRDKLPYGGNIKAAQLLGDMLARKAKSKGIKTVVFDRGGYLYHGRLKALADTARKEGLEF